MVQAVTEVLCVGSRSELMSFLAPPELGMVRVYRGQTQRYPKGAPDTLLSALHRETGGGYDPAWMASVKDAVFGAAGGDSNELSQVWLPALLQHYGPGSFFLDVTTRPDVALWFALNRHVRDTAEIRLTFRGQPATVSVPFAYYQPLELPFSEKLSPVIYVFDALRWTGFGRPAHGDLVAVRNLPAGQRLLHRASRLDRQEAYLLYADPDAISGPDLAFALRAVICLSKNFAWDGSVPSWKTAELFPPPSKDPCYAALWEIPLLPKISIGEYYHPLNLTWYVSSPEVAKAGARASVDPTGAYSAESDDLISRLHAHNGGQRPPI